MFKYVPNILTITRFFLIPLIIYYLVQENYVLAIMFLALSGLTDVLDGFIARKFNFITNFGKLVDPLADKTTQISILGVLVIQNIIPFWILVIVILKEFALVSGASFLYGKEFVVSSRWYGKISTVLFYVAIICSIFIRYWNSNLKEGFQELWGFDIYIYYLALIATLFSLLMYFKAFYVQGYLKKENLTIDKKEE